MTFEIDPPTVAEAKRDAWLDDLYREATANIAWLIGCSADTAKSLYGHLVEAEAEAIKRAAEDEDFAYEWQALQVQRDRRRAGITQAPVVVDPFAGIVDVEINDGWDT